MTGKILLRGLIALGLFAGSAQSAFAEDEAPAQSGKGFLDFTVTGTVGLVSDYRFRGVSQTDKHMAIQGGLTVMHKSGLYASTWASNLAGWGQFGGANMELDLVGGYTKTFKKVTADVGLTWYMYPGGSNTTDFAEPYVKLSAPLGPVSALVGVAYAPKQKALGNFSNTPTSRGQSWDNLYVWGDVNYAIPGTKLKPRAHVGHSNGNPGLGPNGTSVTPTGAYWDWNLGADYAVAGPISVGISYIDTNISKAKAAYLQPNFSSTKDGSSIAGSTVVFSLTAAF
ncbi:TorF family putative porin [Novosphingobium terrae]|uniref:TorF family putative porin n=1 Tax=Novosphingobium terrae TaxID=2726189 RepID=UPI00197D8F4F|nr:TorF family putative porin [Novosphingobium terrae]